MLVRDGNPLFVGEDFVLGNSNEEGHPDESNELK